MANKFIAVAPKFRDKCILLMEKQHEYATSNKAIR